MSRKDLSREIVPRILEGNWWDIFDYPERIMDQLFGVNLFEDDLLPVGGQNGRCRRQINIADSGKSEVKNDKDKFQIDLNVSQFKPEELEVKIADKYVVIHGKHEEKSDEHGFVAREFTRRYMLPDTCDAETVNCSLSPNGMLTILAPKKANKPPLRERKIPLSIKEKKAMGDAK
ncbi:alpha-crystallin A chain-like [Argiope bruennichi]|uniref:alpha-crystallin A chain-like n=1 Tax=Argiope bruennichi TaxID=94029 RepID=UPI002495929B|nr:alpha-crystallin A chain-like [Argiope bruennichi]